jgi:glycosyltransferase involved in cell wall biosynthesis
MSEHYGQLKNMDVTPLNLQSASRSSLLQPPAGAIPNDRWNGMLNTAVEAAAAKATVSLSLVLPCFNEELNIGNTIRSAQDWFREAHVDGEIIVTDDGSKDGSLALLHKLQAEMPNLKVVHHEKNQGYGAAIRSGCDLAEKTWIAFMDSDGQFQSKDISRLLNETAEADYVTGIRARRADTLPRKLNSFMYRSLVRVLLGVHPTDLNCGMKLFRRSIWKTIRPVYATGALINGEMFFAMKNSNIAWKETVVPHYPRVAGKPTGAKTRVILKMFLELWRLKRSLRPAEQIDEQEMTAAQI